MGNRFIEKIGNEKVVLIYDSDVDGVASASLLIHAIDKLGKKVDKTLPCGWWNVENIKKILKGFDKVITVDVPVDLIKRNFLEECKEMLIIDHHPCDDLNSENIVLINPRLEKPTIYQPTSYVVYKMFKFLKKYKWLAILGTIGDFGVDDCKDLVKVKDKKSIWKSKYGKASLLLTSGISILGPEKVLEILLNSQSLKDLVSCRDIKNAVREFEKELRRTKKEFEKNLEVHGDVWISHVKPKYGNICSALITQLSTKNPEKIILIFKENERVKIHGRCGSRKVDIGRLFRDLKIGGGHEAAGAGFIDKKEKNKVKIEILRKLKDFIA